jgi:glycosyltransferase involved in cell wall biosynthesis
MDIVFVVPSYHTNLYFALKALTENGHRIHLICSKSRRNSPEFLATHTIVNHRDVTYARAWHILRNLNPSIVVIRKTRPLSTYIYRASVTQRRKIIGYDQRPYLHPRPLGKVLHGMLSSRPSRRFTPVYGVPEAGRPDTRATYIPFPVNSISEHTNRDYAPDGEIRILCVAKLAQKRKNHFLLLRALEPLATTYNFRITFVGSSTLDTRNPDPATYYALQRYITCGYLSERTVVRQDVPFEDMPVIYRTHDICVLPSRAEPLGTAPLEAMAHGCAVIVSSDAGSAYYVMSGENAGLTCGALFESDNEIALRNELIEVMSDHAKLRRLGQNAAEWTRREFSPDVFVKRFNSLLSSM